MKYLLFCVITVLTASLYLYSCANRTIPTGGPKDTIPPTLIKASPEHKSLNFNEDKIVLTFDEFIKTKDVNSQLIITPRLEEENEYKVNKNVLTIELNQPLDSSTTYTFNFQEAVQDINESTPARDLVLAFSTGTYIDSLSIQGRVVELLTNKPVKGAVVALYDANDTLDLFNSKPQYFTRTGEDGTYSLENLKADTFKIYAFNDQNKNLTAQSDIEAYGFKAKEFILDSVNTLIDIPLIRRNVKEFQVQSARPNGKYFDVKLNKYIEDYEVKVVKGQTADSIITNPIENRSTIRFYNTINSDSVATQITAIDTIGQTIVDTVTIKFPTTQRTSDPISFTVSPASNQQIEESFTGTITFNKPTYIVSMDSAIVYYDSLTVDSIKATELSWNKFHDVLTIDKKLSKATLDNIKIKNDSLQLKSKNKNIDSLSSINDQKMPDAESQTLEKGRKPAIRESTSDTKENDKEKNKFDKTASQLIVFFSENTFKSIEGDTISEIKLIYSFKENKDMALVKGTILTEKDNFIIQLLDKNFIPVKELINTKSFTFRLLPPGEYQMRILIDNDGDGKWEPGNILEGEEPEEVFFLKDLILVRANWEIELEAIDID